MVKQRRHKDQIDFRPLVRDIIFHASDRTYSSYPPGRDKARHYEGYVHVFRHFAIHEASRM